MLQDLLHLRKVPRKIDGFIDASSFIIIPQYRRRILCCRNTVYENHIKKLKPTAIFRLTFRGGYCIITLNYGQFAAKFFQTGYIFNSFFGKSDEIVFFCLENGHKPTEKVTINEKHRTSGLRLYPRQRLRWREGQPWRTPGGPTVSGRGKSGQGRAFQVSRCNLPQITGPGPGEGRIGR